MPKKTYGFPKPFFAVAESLINKGFQRFLPQDCPRIIIKIKQPNFV